ncbi:MAG: type II 3-dehydroquinate dehydratase [Desulfobacterales bacterium]|nr:type II 3-dehydroquinate dehydratase [Desulfobacterales bacterium]
MPTIPMKRILVIHGPNLNRLGRREPDIYGSHTLETIDAEIIQAGKAAGVAVQTFQSNHEGALVDRIQQAAEEVDGLIINPAAYTHTSVALRDALQMLAIPVIEVHLSNIYRREDFRQHSMTAAAATGQIAGLGKNGYLLALEALVRLAADAT